MYAHQQSVARSRRGGGKIHAGWILTNDEAAADDVRCHPDNPYHRKASYPRLTSRTWLRHNPKSLAQRVLVRPELLCSFLTYDSHCRFGTRFLWSEVAPAQDRDIEQRKKRW